MHDKASLADTLRSALGLNPTEAQIVMRLTTQGCVAREQICGIGTCGHRSVKLGSVNAIIRGLRRKLTKHKIELATVNGFGYALPSEARKKVLELLAAQLKSYDRAQTGPRQPAGDVLGAKIRPAG